MIKNLYATYHFFGLMLSKTLRILTVSGSFYNGSLDKSSPQFESFPERGYATFNRNTAYRLIPVTIRNLNHKVML
ncbi:hypothetical protein FEM33_11370 [Dyadobacter flavalbus]|uniref:Uncharacterized protein n=1 Tax=Dyadobacter flavalbus TaxID=2579942 RepID=A0A5M8R028_9BACT|nr:hypothetical protein [Dyadobacter flavalbus]KAA6439612.1 hypothetical protein FEM33_11370 [Dyadobacter flavalbus]